MSDSIGPENVGDRKVTLALVGSPLVGNKLQPWATCVLFWGIRMPTRIGSSI
ncbi:hypothetical protein [Ochrobactrum sp. CGA5]|uniref:hypothetical protein n=1 Tax=Ochrobactrum sp. CGA5 TaxID=2583453 RepID=UPI0015D644DB|nr:hypothetical protein [Ochrobactrum sp. CGA5]